MKPITWTESNKKLVDNETPFKVIELPEGLELRLYWRKGGAFGWQVQALLYGRGAPLTYKTDGCGYCKEGAALDEAFKTIGSKPREYMQGNPMPHEYHVGGNFYTVSKSDWLKY